MDLGTTVEHTLHRQTLFALRLAKRPGEVHSKPACHADRPGCAGVANADRESKLVGMPVPWTCDLDRTSRSCSVFCSLQCMRSVHWSTQATAAALVHRQMAMRPLWRRSNAEEGHGHRNAADAETARGVKKPVAALATLRGSQNLEIRSGAPKQ